MFNKIYFNFNFALVLNGTVKGSIKKFYIIKKFELFLKMYNKLLRNITVKLHLLISNTSQCKSLPLHHNKGKKLNYFKFIIEIEVFDFT
jgi:hypothetical protein